MKESGFPSVDQPWLQYYDQDSLNLKFPECSFYELLWQNNHTHGDELAILYMGNKITYQTLFERIDRTAAAFSALGVKEGDIVSVAMPNLPEMLYCVYALNKIGAISNMVHPLCGESDLIYYVNEVKSKVVVMFDGTYEIIRHAPEKLSCEHIVVVSPADSLPLGIKQLYLMKNPRVKKQADSILPWPDFLKKGQGIRVETVKRNIYDLALISHTGGTTGTPKGVMCSDYNITSHIVSLAVMMKHERQDRMLAVLPPFINYSLVTSMLLPISEGATAVLIPKYEANRFNSYVRKYRPNFIASIPDYWLAILDKDDNTDYSCFKFVFFGGEKMSEDNEDAVNAYFAKHNARVKLCKGLGATEIVSAAAVSFGDCNLRGSVGVPIAGINCKIVEPETENELPIGKEGEICFSGKMLMLGYYNNEEDTQDLIHIHKDGVRWMHTGDLGHLDKNGVLFITGRIKRILPTLGPDGNPTKLFPERVEKVIQTVSEVSVCCVIGVPDVKRVYYPKAFVVLQDGIENAEKIKERIVKVCQEKLPDYMIPYEYEYVDSLPRTSRGKVDYRALEEINAKNQKCVQ